MSSDKPTVQMEPDDPQQQPDDQDRPTVMAGQEAGQVPPQVDSEGFPFRPTSPPQYPTPPSPTPYQPAPPPSSPPVTPVPAGRATVIMEPEREPIPLAWLAVIEGAGAPSIQLYTLGRETVVGRTTGDLVLSQDPAISSQHLKIKMEASEEDEQVFVLYDLASANGTFVGDKKTYQDEENRVYRHVLSDGDYISIGQTTLVFKQI